MTKKIGIAVIGSGRDYNNIKSRSKLEDFNQAFKLASNKNAMKVILKTD